MTICMLLSKPGEHDIRVLQEKETLSVYYSVKLLTGTRRPSGFWCCWWILETPLYFFRAPKADVYHCHDHDTLLLGLLLSWRYRAKLVLDQHEFWFELIKRDKLMTFADSMRNRRREPLKIDSSGVDKSRGTSGGG